jgi:DNA-binding transcriptional ArsR family regulator
MSERYKKVSFYIILYMNKILLDTQDVAENEDSMIFNLRPEFNRICYNSIRASIIHLLVKSKELNHSLSVEEIAYKLGKRHSVVIHHLEKLNQCKIVEIIRLLKYGDKERRSIWGLNMKYPNLVQNIYSHMLKTFYTANELDKMCCINKNIRKIL